MKRAVLVVAALLVAVYAAALFVPIDPEERRPGTRLSGAISQAPEDWSERLKPRTKVWVQTNTWYLVPHSVTTVSFALDGDLYIPCARCGTKRWPKNVARDPDVVVKVGDSLYERKAVRVEESRVLDQLLGGRLGELEDVWLFRMAPRD